MSAVATEAIELSAIQQRTSNETCTSNQAGAASLDGSTLQAACTSDSDTTDSSAACQLGLSQASTRHEGQVYSTNSSGGSPNRILQFLLRTWLGNILAIIALLVAIASLGMTAYSSVLQAVAAKWSMRNDAFQSCLSASTLNISSRYCNELLVDGFEAPPGIVRTRRDPTELRKTDSDNSIQGFDPSEFLRQIHLPSRLIWSCALLIMIVAAIAIFAIFLLRIYSQEQRRDAILSVARLPACSFLGGLGDSALLSTMMQSGYQCSDEQQPSYWSAGVAIVEEALGNDEETLSEYTGSRFLTKIGVSYHSDDECDDSDDDLADKVFQLNPNNLVEQEDDHDLGKGFNSPTNPHEMSLWFEADAKALREIIMNATTTCKTFDRNGAEIAPELCDSFCADKDLFQVLLSQKSFIKRLYVEAKQAQMFFDYGTSCDESDQVVQDAIASADAFFNGVLLRTKAFAILVSTCVSPTSEMWARFEQDCFLPETSRASAAFTDNLLPFEIETAKLRLGSDYECFYSRQWHFCPVKLREGSVVEYTHPEECLRLPFLEKHYSCSASPRTMTHAKLKDDPLDTGLRDAFISMKRLQYTAERWREIKDIVASGSIHKHVAHARMALKTEKCIYLFFKAGTHTLYNYMTKANISGPKDFTDVEAHFRSMLGIAEALKYLCSSEIQRSHGACSFANLSSDEDILVDVSDGVANLQLAYPAFAERNYSSLHNYIKLDVHAFRRVFTHYVAWLSGGAVDLSNVDTFLWNPQISRGKWSQNLDRSRIVPVEQRLADVLKGVDAATAPQERLFYERLLWFYKNHLSFDNPRHPTDLLDICATMTMIQDSLPSGHITTSKPAAEVAPTTEPSDPPPIHSSGGNAPSGRRRRLPWSRRRESTGK